MEWVKLSSLNSIQFKTSYRIDPMFYKRCISSKTGHCQLLVTFVFAKTKSSIEICAKCNFNLSGINGLKETYITYEECIIILRLRIAMWLCVLPHKRSIYLPSKGHKVVVHCRHSSFNPLMPKRYFCTSI